MDAYANVFFDRTHDVLATQLAPEWMLDRDASREFVAAHFARPGADTALDAALRLDSQVMLVDDPVKRVDNMTMAWGLEARVPFLDHELVELAAACPPELKLAAGGKGVLKEAARGIVPDEVIDRPKGYFPVPGDPAPRRAAARPGTGRAVPHRRPAARGLFRREYVEALLARSEHTPDDARRERSCGSWRCWRCGFRNGGSDDGSAQPGRRDGTAGRLDADGTAGRDRDRAGDVRQLVAGPVAGRPARRVRLRPRRPAPGVGAAGGQRRDLPGRHGCAPGRVGELVAGGGWLACMRRRRAARRAPRCGWSARTARDLHQVAGFGADTACGPRWLPGRPLLAVTENSTRALVVDATTGERRVLAEGALIALLDVSADGRRALLRRGPRGRRHLERARPRYGRGAHGSCRPTSGSSARTGARVYARSDGDREFAALVRVRDDRIDVLAERPDAELEDFALTADGGAAALVWNVDGGRSELTLLDVATGTGTAVGPLPGAVVDDCAFAPDGADPGSPPRDRASRTPSGVVRGGDRSVRWAPAAITDRGASRRSCVPVVTPRRADPDRLAVPAGRRRPVPDRAEPARRPGGAGAARVQPAVPASLVDRGIAVFAPNVRGSSGFGRTFVNADNGARPVRRDRRRGGVRGVPGDGRDRRAGPDRRAWAARTAGYLTLAALVTYPELFAAGVDVCGMANFATFYADTEPWIAAAAVSKYGDPVADADLLRDLSPITRIDRLTAPLLVVHGGERHERSGRRGGAGGGGATGPRRPAPVPALRRRGARFPQPHQPGDVRSGGGRLVDRAPGGPNGWFAVIAR